MLLRVPAVHLQKEILVIDDGSTDGTRELLQDLENAQAAGQAEAPVRIGRALLPLENMRFIFQERNCGGFSKLANSVMADRRLDHPTELVPLQVGDGGFEVLISQKPLGTATIEAAPAVSSAGSRLSTSHS